MKFLLVGAGGFIGSVLRYALGGFVQQSAKNAKFPIGTLAVNLIGCFVIGLLSHLAEARGLFSLETRALLFTGLLGGFTTYSAFGNESFSMLHDGETTLAFLNIASHIILGLGAVWLGRVVVS